MKKPHSRFVCQTCGYESPRWIGKCPNCGAWNSCIEELIAPRSPSPHTRTDAAIPGAVPITDLSAELQGRLSTRIPELDRVLGGGIVRGSVVLVGGDPGIGKSTLMMQMAGGLGGGAVLYVSGEESVHQIKLRADRLGLSPSKQFLVLPETNLDVVQTLLERTPPDLLIVDSIQTMYRPGLESAPGTVSQVREATALFVRFAKEKDVPVFVVGHVTKEGAIAGPKVVEHMVDTVLQFEGERQYAYRVLRALKNRFGSTNEIGVFEMLDRGLREVTNPSQVFLAERRAGTSGSAVVAGVEGTRPILLEVQALVAPASYGVPQRTATGFDSRRLQMLLAVLEKRVGLHVGQYDVFVNVAGGVRIDEPAADLGMALSIVSSLRDQPVDPDAVVTGEIGLGGEIRRVFQVEKRIMEAQKLGFTKMLIPSQNLAGTRTVPGIEILEAASIEEAIGALITQRGKR